MTTPVDLFRWYQGHIGMPYDAGHRRCDPNHNGTDCSCAVARALRSCGIDPGPNETSTSLELWARHSGGRAISVAQGIATPGAGLFIWGYGPAGHVEVSRGNGTTYGTPAWGPYGHALGIGNAYSHHWTGAVLWPNVDYSGHAPSPAPYPPLHRVLRPGNSGPDVQAAQLRLIMWAHVWKDAHLDPGLPDGIYGAHTGRAVRHFQSRTHLVVDGLVGPATWAELWKH